MIFKFETTVNELNKLWSTMPFTKEDVLTLAQVLPIKKEHENINIQSSATLLHELLSTLPKELSLEEFTAKTMDIKELSLLTFGDTEVALPLYEIYQKDLTLDEIKMAYYILSNVNQIEERLPSLHRQTQILLGATLYPKKDTISFFTLNENILEENNLQGQRIPLTLNDKEQFLLSLNIHEFLKNKDNFIDEKINIDSVASTPKVTRKLLLHKATNFFTLANKNLDDKEFALKMYSLFAKHKADKNYTNEFIQSFCELVNIDREDFSSNILDFSIAQNFHHQFFEGMSASLLQDKEIATFLYQNLSDTVLMNYYTSDKNFKKYLVSHFDTFMAQNDRDGILNIFHSKPSFDKNINVSNIQSFNAKKSYPFYLINQISNEIEQYLSHKGERPIDDFLNPSQKAIKEFLASDVLSFHDKTLSYDQHFYFLITFTLLNPIERYNNQALFINTLIHNHSNITYLKNTNIFTDPMFLPKNINNVLHFVSQEYIDNNKERLAFQIKTFQEDPSNKEFFGKHFLVKKMINVFKNELQEWFTNKNYSTVNSMFVTNFEKHNLILDGFNPIELHNARNFSKEYLEQIFQDQKPLFSKLSLDDFKDCFNELKKTMELFKDTESSKTIQVELLTLNVYTHFFFKKCFPDVELKDLIDLQIDNYNTYSSIFPKYLSTSLFNPKMLQDFDINNPENKEIFKNLVRQNGFIDGINDNFDNLQHLKSFFMDIENIKNFSIPASAKSPVSSKKLYLGNIYTKHDVATIYEKMGNDYNWISISPFMFIIKAPSEVRNDPNFWIHVCKNYTTKTSILNLMPIAMTKNPQLVYEASIHLKKKPDIFTKTFSSNEGLTTENIMKILDEKDGLEQIKRISPSIYTALRTSFKDESSIADRIDEIIIKASSIKPSTTAKTSKPKKF